MRALRRTFALPLLAKELTERAARRRTYWMRGLTAALLYLVFWAENGALLSGDLRPAALLGSGRQMFESLVNILFTGIYLFVPTLVCGVVTQEKERDSLSLLLLTELRPWQIVVQKYLAALIPSLTLLLLALPLGGLAYSYGGFSSGELVFDLLLLLLATLQTGALALWASCRFRTTAAAFIGTYVIGLALVFVPLFPLIIGDTMGQSFVPAELEPYLGIHLPVAVRDQGNWSSGSPVATWGPVVIGLTTVLFLRLATHDLTRYAFAPARAWLRLWFGRLDEILRGLNRRVGNFTFLKAASFLPGDRPIVWREQRARGLTRPEYLLRLLVAVEIPTILLASISATPGWGRQTLGLSLLGAVVGILATLVVAVAAANVFVTERVNQTLDVLLTTALDPKEIVRQKAAALRRLVLVMAIPVLTIFLIEAICENTTPWTGYAETLNLQRPIDTFVPYLLIAGSCTLLGLATVAWLGLWIGLRSRTRLQAICGTLGTIIGWCLAPHIVVSLLDRWLSRFDEAYIAVFSPLTVPTMNEMSALHELPLGSVILSLGVLVGALLYLRALVFQGADYWLRR